MGFLSYTDRVFRSLCASLIRDGVVTFSVRVHPGAPWTRVKGVLADPPSLLRSYGRAGPTSPRSTRLRRASGMLKIDIAAVPEEGKANAELVRFLAEEFHVPKSHVEILRGQTSKTKVVQLRG